MVNISIPMENIEIFFLIWVRIASFIFIAPFYSLKSPQRVRAGLSFIIAVLLYGVVPHTQVEYATVIEYMGLVLKEASVGLLIGLAAKICEYIISFAGRFIDMEIGFSMVTLFDPLTNQQVSISGNLYSYLIMMLLIVTNMYQVILRAVVDSYSLIPIGGMAIHANRLLQVMITYMTDSFVIGFRIMLPFFAVMLVLNIILGVLAKVAPQMNMFVVGMQLKILLGLVVMLITVSLLPGISNFIFTEMRTLMVAVIEAMQ